MCRTLTAVANGRPVTWGTVEPFGKQPDQMIPTKDPLGLGVPGASGVAPTFTCGSGPGTASETTTLWPAGVPLPHGVFIGTGKKPATRR